MVALFVATDTASNRNDGTLYGPGIDDAETFMATTQPGTGKMVGAQVRRVEDPRVLLGPPP
jgi:hypothetical protein